MNRHLIFLDLETGGLDAVEHSILEIAMVAYDPITRKAVDTFQRVLPFGRIGEKNISPAALEMHKASGLWDEVTDLFDRLGSITARVVYQRGVWEMAVEFVKKHTSQEKWRSPLCGNTVSFDRKFLLQDMPELEKLFSYRHLDVSSLNIIADEFYPDQIAGERERSLGVGTHGYLERVVESGGHRALPDCMASIKQLEGYLEQFDMIGAPYDSCAWA